ncbi:MAG: hypothetical protein E6377_17790 [Clostridium sp.]|uniref:hypothetical protein n=1 Tax=Clostridium sp. TaxID=1506 RepID=UPI00290927AA|nr:hypothetical protein [Clostridium sp.]MDU6876310.1 hypothetical protein [Clostridium sp.]MDU6937331.1 hypothetical protein [Clostridium sp.]
MDIIEIIAKALESISSRGITVVQGWYDQNINDTHITFCELSDRSNNISDDKEEDVVHTIQIDIWSLKDEWKLKKEVKKLMLLNDFGYVEGQDFFETDTKIHHKALRFTYLEEVE